MGKPHAAAATAAAAAPRTPKTAELPFTTTLSVDPPVEAAALPSPASSSTLLSRDQLRDFAQAATSIERLAVLTTAWGVHHYEANPRSLVWIDLCFSVLTFALEEALFNETKTLALLQVTNALFTFATTSSAADELISKHPSSPAAPLPYPTVQATYDLFRQLVRANSVSAEPPTDADSVWDPSEVTRIVAFMSVTFFRHLAAYQHVFQFPRECLEREIALMVELPSSPTALALATLLPDEDTTVSV